MLRLTGDRTSGPSYPEVVCLYYAVHMSGDNSVLYMCFSTARLVVVWKANKHLAGWTDHFIFLSFQCTDIWHAKIRQK
jgi:hypothetical protein